MAYDIAAPEFVPYLRNGQPVEEGVGFEIIPRMGWEDFKKYMDLSGTVKPEDLNTSTLDEIAVFLMDRAFVRFVGVVKNGAPLEKAQWREAPHDLLLQIIRTIQIRNSGQAQAPNSSAPSVSSSEEPTGEARPTN